MAGKAFFLKFIPIQWENGLNLFNKENKGLPKINGSYFMNFSK
jgi:hypothetical protein